MKNLLFSLIALLSISGISAQDITKLNEDREFITYITNEANFIKNSPRKDLLNTIFADKKLEENELSTFYTIFGTDAARFNSFTESQNSMLKALSVKYNFNGHSDLQQILIVEIGEIQSSVSRDNCQQRYDNAIATNAAAMVVAHFGCASVDWTGVGAIVCHAAVFVVYLAANDNALLDYQDCKNK
ncbi:MAG: hypothetical protein PSV16_14045 [Flavobacterium sp.]|nr:hypothetical protein [Flavobacterium sp.]